MWNNWDEIENALDTLPPVVYNLLIAGVSLLCGLLIKWLISAVLHFYEKRAQNFSLLRSMFLRVGKPLNHFIPLLVFNGSLPLMKLRRKTEIFLDKGTEIMLILSFAAVLIGMVKVAEDYVYKAYDLSKSDNLRERKVRTQLQFLRKLVIAMIVVLAICAILLSFENLRRIGAGLLTGVGVGGIIIGFAAQRSLGNLLAGMQIAFTQPIRIDDVLIVEGEWGRVEEITLTYVVLNIWDKRRLILPINYFIEKPFQNWTRNSADILGVVFLYLDYNAPMAEIRKEFNRLIEQHPLWDKKVSVVQVTDSTERTIQVRFLVSSTDSGRAFDLRCYVREQLIAFIQTNYPDSLPKTRMAQNDLMPVLKDPNA